MTASHLLPSPVQHTWSEQEKRILARTAVRACACGVGSSWILEIKGPQAELFERFDMLTWHHDNAGRDRVITCGAALAALVAAARMLGWLPEVALLPDSHRPDLVARVTTRGRHRPTPVDARFFQAAFDRRRHRDTVDPTELPPDLLAEFVQAGESAEVEVLPMTSFTPTHRKQTVDPGLLVVTMTDGRRDRVLAGAAMQRIWLTAKARGFTAEPEIQPFQFREFRQRMLKRSGLTGSPQLLLRLGR